ncbi:hypothetical protein TorRG33x02_317320 [Trema orientale]|uniref:Transmembrane protein n=1 Tax=Trema orientale TaxID=63057 RepID=A0A2P5BL18_TREOI|nr:hypothetical protein TorRG33x02_317320 [Trema orientale]
MLRPIVALDVATRLLMGIGAQALAAVLEPEVGGVAAVGVVGLGGGKAGMGMGMGMGTGIVIFIFIGIGIGIGIQRVRVQLDGEPLVVTPGGALQFVEAGECGGGYGVHLAKDGLTGAREVDEEGDAVGPTDKWVVEFGAVGSEEHGVPAANEVLQ